MIYLDNAATTKPIKQALDVFVSTQENFYNPSAIYLPSIKVEKLINEVRLNILSTLGLTTSHNVIFTSGATESNNMALLQSKRFKGKTVLISNGEHSSVFNCAKNLEGMNVLTINLTKTGEVDVDHLKQLLKQNDVCFVSTMFVNNETGAINDINNIAKIVKTFNKDIIFHTDAVQGFKKLFYKFSKDIDLISISAHKIGGFKGTGALIYANSINLKPLIYGGGQEFNLRSGTENVGGILAFGEAIKQTLNIDKIKKMFELAKSEIEKRITNIKINSFGSPYVLNVSILGVRSEVVLRMLADSEMFVSSGSACNSKKADNRVLNSMGIPKEYIEGTIRISFFDGVKLEDIKTFTKKLAEIVKELRR